MKPETEPAGRSRRENWVPRAAVATVAVAAIGAAVMVKRAETAAPLATSPQQSVNEPASGAVVKAPPLKPARPVAQRVPDAKSGTSAMGGPPACADCGVVETVVAVHEHAKPKPSGYQMHIRMDDGSIRTVQQRGALAAGSRVRVDGSSVRALAPNG